MSSPRRPRCAWRRLSRRRAVSRSSPSGGRPMRDAVNSGGLKRGADLGMITGIAQKFPASTSLAIFSKTCFNRYFELEVARVYNSGIMKLPIYLSLGQEHIPAAISAVTTELLIFAQHRAHSYYLSFGGDVPALIDELLHRPSGCARGMG